MSLKTLPKRAARPVVFKTDDFSDDDETANCIDISTAISTVDHDLDQSMYTLVNDGNQITAWIPEDKMAISLADVPAKLDDDEQKYPAEYTPTAKMHKGPIPPPNDDPTLRKFPCPFKGCQYIAKYRSNLWDHKKTHTGEKPYACNWPSCTMRFSQTHQLKLHHRSHTGERPFHCYWPGCTAAFSQKPGLKSHILTHTGEKPHKCDYPGCEWRFRLRGALTDHKRAIHENGKNYICDWPGCKKRFLQQCHLSKHMMGHCNEKPFACDWPNCNYKAVTLAYVTNHRKTHTGEKNYECTYPGCGRRFMKSSHVNRHRSRCHPVLVLEEDITDSEVDTAKQVKNEVVAQEEENSPHVDKQDGDGELHQLMLTNENSLEDEECTTLYFEEITDGVTTGERAVQIINGTIVMTNDAGQQFIISTNGESGEIEATPILIN